MAFVMKERRKDFRPSGGYKGLEQSPRKLMARDSDLDKERETELKYQRPPPKTMLVDAETGEPLSITKARWTTTEGRLSLNAKTIIDMGTGKLDVRSRVNEQIRAMSPPKSASSSSSSSTKAHSFPLSEEDNRIPIRSPLKSAGSLLATQQYHQQPSSLSSSNNRHKEQATAAACVPSSASVASSVAVESLMTLNIPHTLQSVHQERHPLIAEFLEKGPLTPIMHTLWDPRTNTVIFDDNQSEGDGQSIESGSSSSVSHLNPSALSSGPTTGAPSPSVEKVEEEYKLGDYDIIPKSIALTRRRNWNAILEKTFIELYSYAEKLELNKTMTQEDRIPGGLPGVRKVCQDLARMKMKYMKELVQAIDDEAKKEEKRELYEFENRDKGTFLETVKKKHQEQRAKGKQYIEALRRDQEIVFMHKMREAGLLW